MKITRFRFWVISKWITTVFFLFISFKAHSQEAELPLKVALDSLEERYEVVFSYADENIVNKKIILPDEKLSLDECLKVLSQGTGLLFEKLDERYVAVQVDLGHSICGYLLDSVNRDPIVAAILSTGSAEKHTTSDENGYFKLPIEGSNAELSILHVSYTRETLTLTPSKDCYTIFLNQRIAELPEVFISNYLVKGLDRKTDGSFDVRTKELQVLPGLSEPDVLYTMQVLPGIQSPLESVSNINIRGGTNDQNLIRWDRIRMFQSSHFYGLISAFNPYFTDYVSLIKNGSSVKFGESVSGVLDIFSDDGIATDLSGGGGVNLISADAHMSVPISSKASLSFSARRSIADLVETPTYKNYFERAFSHTDISQTNGSDANSERDFVFYDLSGKLNFHLTDRDRIHLSFIHMSNDLNYQEELSTDTTIAAKKSVLTQSNTGASLNYSRTWAPGFKTNFTSYVSSYGLAALNNDILNNQRLIQENDVLDVGITIDTRLELNPGIDLISGLQYEETGIANLEDLNNPEFRRRIKEVMTRYIGFSEINYTSQSGHTNFIFGVRANYFEQINRFTPEPRLVFRQDVLPGLAFEVLGEFKSQSSTQIIDLQTDFLGVEKRRWVLSDDGEIPLIQSKQVSSGFQFLKNKLLISGEGYFKVVDGIITSSQAFQSQFEFLRSAGNYRIYGLDFLINKQFEKISSWVSYSPSKNVYQFQELSVVSFPNNVDVRHNITAGIGYANDHFQFSSGVNWFSGIPYTPVDHVDSSGGGITYASPNSDRLKPYFRTDLSAKYLFDIGEKVRAQIGFSIWNLTDSKNILRRYYQVDNNEEVSQVDQFGLDFTPNTMLRVSY